MIRLRLPFTALLALAVLAPACGGSEESDPSDASDTSDDGTDTGTDTGDAGVPFAVDPERVLGDIAVLADDAMQGRESGTPGNRAALEYVAKALEGIGALPAGDGGGWYWGFTYPEWRETEPSTLAIDGEPAVAGIDFDVLRYSPPGAGEGEVVFIGYGLTVPPFDAAEYPDCPFPPAGYDDLAGLDLSGKVALKFSGVPTGDTSISDTCPLEDALQNLEQAGILAVLAVPDYLRPGNLVAGATLQYDVEYPVPFFYVRRDLAEQWVPDLFERYDTLLARDATAGVATEIGASFGVFATRKDAVIDDVLGVIPGTDPVLAREVIVVGGHVDHVGAEPGGGVIYNGADDNASGTAMMVEMARGVASLPGGPARTVLFAGWNAEECGLFGSCSYVDDPVYPLEDTRAVFSLDSVGAGDGSGILLVGGEEPQNGWLADLVQAASLEQGATGIVYPYAEIAASDQACFFDEGVTAVDVQSLGPHAAAHTEADTIDTILPEDLATSGGMVWATVRALALGIEDQYLGQPKSAARASSGGMERGRDLLAGHGEGQDASERARIAAALEPAGLQIP
jgi:hypothetical protein